MRALANQERLSLSNFAASLAVSNTMIGVAGLCAAAEQDGGEGEAIT
jgi:hypothetical protein